MEPCETDRGDPFGLIACHYDALMAKVPYGLWADYVTQLTSLAGKPIRPGSRLLDLATGTGSVGLEFASRGCSVVGIDSSEPMLTQARRKAAERGLDASFLCQDLSDFRLPCEFDYAVCLYDSLNYILETDLLKRAFANTHGALRRQGLIVFDVNTIRALEAELFTQESPPDAAVTYRWVSRYHRRTRISTIQMNFEIPATSEKFTVVHRQRAYTDRQLRRVLKQAGFAQIAAYEGYRLEPPTAKSDRVFYVARATH